MELRQLLDYHHKRLANNGHERFSVAEGEIGGQPSMGIDRRLNRGVGELYKKFDSGVIFEVELSEYHNNKAHVISKYHANVFTLTSKGRHMARTPLSSMIRNHDSRFFYVEGERDGMPVSKKFSASHGPTLDLRHQAEEFAQTCDMAKVYKIKVAQHEKEGDYSLTITEFYNHRRQVNSLELKKKGLLPAIA